MIRFYVHTDVSNFAYILNVSPESVLDFNDAYKQYDKCTSQREQFELYCQMSEQYPEIFDMTEWGDRPAICFGKAKLNPLPNDFAGRYEGKEANEALTHQTADEFDMWVLSVITRCHSLINKGEAHVYWC